MLVKIREWLISNLQKIPHANVHLCAPRLAVRKHQKWVCTIWRQWYRCEPVASRKFHPKRLGKNPNPTRLWIKIVMQLGFHDSFAFGSSVWFIINHDIKVEYHISLRLQAAVRRSWEGSYFWSNFWARVTNFASARQQKKSPKIHRVARTFPVNARAEHFFLFQEATRSLMVLLVRLSDNRRRSIRILNYIGVGIHRHWKSGKNKSSTFIESDRDVGCMG